MPTIILQGTDKDENNTLTYTLTGGLDRWVVVTFS